MGKSSGSFNIQIWSQLSKAGQVQTKDLLTGFTKLRELVSLSNIAWRHIYARGRHFTSLRIT